MSIMFTR